MSRVGIERSASSTSTLSCITVDNDSHTSSMESSSTPPTSVNDAGSTVSAGGTKDDETSGASGRARRSRHSTINYNENALAGSRRTPIRRKPVQTPAKKDSEETLVPGMDKDAQQLVEDSIQVLDLDWSVDAMPGEDVKQPLLGNKPKARLPAAKETIANASSALQKTASVLGKRSRDAVGAGLGKLQGLGKRRTLRPRVQLPAESQEPAAAPSKKVKLSKEEAGDEPEAKPASSRKASNKQLTKTWLSQGLYVGQDPDFDPRLTNAKNQQKRAHTGGEVPKQRKILPLPMFAGKRLLENGRNFRLPFDVFSPLPPGQPKPEEWKKTQKSKQL